MSNDGTRKSYTFLGIHPNNENYVLLLDHITQDAYKKYIPNIIRGEWYVGEYDSNFFCYKKMSHLIKELESIKNRIESNKKNSVKNA